MSDDFVEALRFVVGVDRAGTVADIVTRRRDRRRRAPAPPPAPNWRTWGGWRLVDTVLIYRQGLDFYPVYVASLTTTAEVARAVFGVASSSWADNVCLAGLVSAIGEIIRPQVNLRGTKALTVARLRQLCDHAVRYPDRAG
jgi:hypothetical protein